MNISDIKKGDILEGNVSAMIVQKVTESHVEGFHYKYYTKTVMPAAMPVSIRKEHIDSSFKLISPIRGNDVKNGKTYFWLPNTIQGIGLLEKVTIRPKVDWQGYFFNTAEDAYKWAKGNIINFNKTFEEFTKYV
jgi:hypothetical protein